MGKREASMSDRTECAHVECACLVARGERYCSEYCRARDESQKADERRNPGQLFAVGHVCNCGHPDCEQRVKSGQAVHEQAR
jgi:hypothetical protein